jgi:hypothetical protein
MEVVEFSEAHDVTKPEDQPSFTESTMDTCHNEVVFRLNDHSTDEQFPTRVTGPTHLQTMVTHSYYCLITGKFPWSWLRVLVQTSNSLAGTPTFCDILPSPQKTCLPNCFYMRTVLPNTLTSPYLCNYSLIPVLLCDTGPHKTEQQVW